MLPPMRPRPIMPSLLVDPLIETILSSLTRTSRACATPLRRRSARQAHRHQEVAVVRRTVALALAGQHGRAGRAGERQRRGVGVDRGQAVEQVGRVERDLQRLGTLPTALESLGCLRVRRATGAPPQPPRVRWDAWRASAPPASSTRPSAENPSRTGALRAATNATRLAASTR